MNDITSINESVQFYVPAEPGALSRELSAVSFLSQERFIRLKNWFISVQELKHEFAKSSVKNYFNKLHSYPDIVGEISRNIDEDCQVRDNASDQLHKIRQHRKRLRARVEEELRLLLADRSSIFTDTTILQRSGRYVLPVKRNFKKEMPGIIHSYSNSGETVFVEPMEISDDVAQLVELDDKEREEIERILKNLTSLVSVRLNDIEEDIENLIQLDLLFAKARFARDFNCTIPVFGEHLNIVNGFHPILKRVKEHAVPLSLRMSPEQKILLISGPNAGGKTVVLKTVGLVVLMAQSGLFIPADEGSALPFFDEVFADIGDEQSIESHLSTFAAHVNQIKAALASNSYSLILLDELMSQTSVEEGSALAIAILDEFSRKTSTVLATTHNEDLKIFVSSRKEMINGGMEFTDRPTYRLILGIPQPSNAIKLAQELGLNGNVIKNAQQLLDKDKMSLNKLFEDLSKELKQVAEERQKLSLLTSDYESKLQEFELKRKKSLDELKEKYKRELIQSKRSIEGMIKELKKAGPKPETIKEVRKFFDEKLSPEEVHEPYHPHIGELVRIRELKKIGQVVAEHGGKFKVSLENIFYWVDPHDMERLEQSTIQ